MKPKKPSRKPAASNRRCLRRFGLRDCAAISNDLAEGFQVTKAELLKLVRAEQSDNQRKQNRINVLRDAIAWVGLTIASHEPPIPEFTKCLIKISDALKQSNAGAEARAQQPTKNKKP